MQDFSFDLNSKEVSFEMRFVFDYKDVFTQHPTNGAAISDSSPAKAVQNSTQSAQLEIKTSESCTGNSSHLSPVAANSPTPVPTAQTGAVVFSNINVSSSDAGPVTVNGSKRHPTSSSSGKTTRKDRLDLAAAKQAPLAASREVLAKTKHPGGRPTKRTDEITTHIAEAISYGLTDEEAAAVVGIDDDTLRRWRKIPEFCGAIKTAVAARKLARLKRIEAGEPGWQGTAWAMERQYPESFARPEIQLNLGRTSADSLKRERMESWLQGVIPSIHQIVDSAPEERNWGSAPTGIDYGTSASVEDVDFDLSFGPK
jgi:hypothetical protein